MYKLTNQDMKEVNSYEKSMIRHELIAQHAGIITFVAIALILIGIVTLIVFA